MSYHPHIKLAPTGAVVPMPRARVDDLHVTFKRGGTAPALRGVALD